MRIKFIYLLLILALATILFLQGCSAKGDTFIVSKQQKAVQSHSGGKFYYSSFNIVLDSADRMFFHNKDSLMNCCDTGADPNYPDYLNLQPADLHPYSDSSLVRLVDSCNKLSQLPKYSIQIASLSDTIHSKRFFYLLRLLQEKKFTNYAVRLATEEEREVLKAKIENRPYDFYKIKWMSRFSNTLFPPPMPDTAK